MSGRVSSSKRLKVYVGIATANRSEVLGAVVPQIANQTRHPDKLVVCAPSVDDIPKASLKDLPFSVVELLSGRGLCIQRNQILEYCHKHGVDVLLFLDDDFLMAPDYIHQLEKLFVENTKIVASTGCVEADGISGPGISVEDGLRIVASLPEKPARGESKVERVKSAYGCNMAIRLEPATQIKARFDENLPLYGWLEDIDFSGQIIHCGDVVRSYGLRGVHLGTKVGRSPGMRLGYSQIANPLYLASKKTITARHARLRIARNVVANVVRLPFPEPWIDRRGRLKGNLKAIGDLFSGRLSPKKILEMQ